MKEAVTARINPCLGKTKPVAKQVYFASYTVLPPTMVRSTRVFRISGGATFVISIPAAPALRIVPGRAEGTGSTAAPVRTPASIQEAR